MNYLASNLKFLKGERTQVQLEELTGIKQTTISRILNPARADGISDPGILTVKALADLFQVSLDDILSRDIAKNGRSPQSQVSGFDRDRLGTALTAIETALTDEGISGKWGKVAPAVIWAYEALAEEIPQTPHQRAIFDAAVKFNLLGEIYDRSEESGRAAIGGSGVRGAAQAAVKKAGPGKAKRRN